MNKLLILCCLSGLVFLSSCDPYTQNEYEEYYVVESYLIANAPLPHVKISKTLPFDEAYSFKKAALNNASVKVQRLDSSKKVEKEYIFKRVSAGVYEPENAEKVMPKHRYKLKVSFPNEDKVEAETYVPGDFHTVGTVPDTAEYQASGRVYLNITRSSYPNRQTYFIFTDNAENPTAGNLTPYYEDLVNDTDYDVRDYSIISSGVVNEKKFKQNFDGTLRLTVPWILVGFFGQNKFVANAIDDNIYDFERSQDKQAGGSTLSPGQIQNIIYNVKGGIGIFGSMASDTISVFIKRPKN